MPPVFLSEIEVKDRLTHFSQAQIKTALKEAFSGLASGLSVQPPQNLMLLPEDAGDCIIYPGVLGSQQYIGMKLSPYLVGLAKAGKYPVTAFTLLLSSESGAPVLLCDSLWLTTLRTAATTSLALDYLIPHNARRLAVVGAGKVGLSHLDFIARQFAWDSINLYSPALADKNPAQKTQRREKLAELNLNVNVSSDLREAVADADVVVLCTSSGEAVVQSDWLKENAVITSISTNVPRAHEIAPQDLPHMTVFCDYRKTAPLAAGEMLIAAEKHGWSAENIVADLPELVSGKHAGISAVSSGRAFFRSIGLGIEDIAIAALLI
ncbi:MAG: ornithine cyclodeaminase family protein [Anaerolineae bacterium]|nr:ornithine cyclodeaminase family protein [Anaerolineae bacterium]